MEQQLLNIITKYMNQGNYAEALDIFKKYEIHYSQDPQYWELLALTQGMSGNNEECKNACLQAIKLNPTNVGSYINLGVALQNLGLLNEAEETLKQALNMDSEHPQVHNNLGAIYILRSEYNKAKPYIKKAISINPNYSDALNNLGEIYKNEQEYEKAIEIFLKSIQLNSNNINACIGLGALFSYLARYNEAEHYLKHAIRLAPYSTEALFNLGFLYYLKKSYDLASKYFKDTLTINPDHSNAGYLLSAISGHKSPEKSPEVYVKNLFDHYAENFDKHLVKDLQYKTPSLMYSVFHEHAKPIETKNLLDLGCGTGISGENFRTLFDHLVGIDLSEKMLIKARQKNIYNELYNQDITTYLEENTLKHDLIIASDVFVYIGDIAELIKFIYKRQSDNGYFIFSIEMSSKHDTFHLRKTGRFSHSKKYIETVLDDTSYKIVSSVATIIRKEKGNDIEGYVYLCQK